MIQCKKCNGTGVTKTPYKTKHVEGITYSVCSECGGKGKLANEQEPHPNGDESVEVPIMLTGVVMSVTEGGIEGYVKEYPEVVVGAYGMDDFKERMIMGVGLYLQHQRSLLKDGLL